MATSKPSRGTPKTSVSALRSLKVRSLISCSKVREILRGRATFWSKSGGSVLNTSVMSFYHVNSEK